VTILIGFFHCEMTQQISSTTHSHLVVDRFRLIIHERTTTILPQSRFPDLLDKERQRDWKSGLIVKISIKTISDQIPAPSHSITLKLISGRGSGDLHVFTEIEEPIDQSLPHMSYREVFLNIYSTELVYRKISSV
jgi:hypothetical protein